MRDPASKTPRRAVGYEPLRARPHGESLLLPQGYNVILECYSPNPAQVVNGVAVRVFLGTATATRGQYGSPEFVSRRRTVRIS